MAVHLAIGRRLTMFCGSAGRGYLSALPAGESRALLEGSRRARYTQTTVTGITELMRLVGEAGRKGYAAANGEFYEGDLGISVPIRDGGGRPVGVLNISCPALRWTLPRMRRELVPMLLETGRLISTTPPPIAKVEPFLLGAGMITRGQAAGRNAKPAEAKRRKP
jgi:DNA-binding IclR family transcriptional regulator